MTKAIPQHWRQATGRFTETFQRLVDHRGMHSEQELIDTFGLDRLKALYEGDDPGFSELVEIARILDAPLSMFQIHEHGAFSELEVAFYEVIHAAGGMTAHERVKLIEELAALPARIKARADDSEADTRSTLPETLVSILRNAAE